MQFRFTIDIESASASWSTTTENGFIFDRLRSRSNEFGKWKKKQKIVKWMHEMRDYHKYIWIQREYWNGETEWKNRNEWNEEPHKDIGI